MKPNPILEELWRVKDDLAREAGYDVERVFSELRAAEARQPGPLIYSTEKLRRYVAEHEQPQSATAVSLNDEPPPPPPEHRE